jgi:chitin disaccharide deacetylase
MFMCAVNKIIVNADDFGYSVAVNQAIIQSFERSLVTSTSLMANMPGFEDAVRLAGIHVFLEGKVGLHLNLTEGYPLSQAIRSCKKFCHPAGYFIYNRQEPLFFLSAQEQAAVYEEMKAQLERVIAAGILPSHLDSHHHIHTEWAIARLAARLGRSYGVRRIRLSRNTGERTGYSRKFYKRVFNQWFLKRYSGITSTDYFGDIQDMQIFLSTRPSRGKSIEIMVHPILEEGVLVDGDSKDLQEQLETLIDRRQNPLYSPLIS